MSNLVFPSTMPGFDIKVSRRNIFSTKIQTAASGKELRAAWWATPRFHYTMQLNFARQTGFSANTLSDEAATLSAFFAAHRGAWDSFWFTDPMVQNLIPNGDSEKANPTGYEAAGIYAGGYQGNYARRALAGQVIQLTGPIPVSIGETIYFETLIYSANANAYLAVEGLESNLTTTPWLAFISHNDSAWAKKTWVFTIAPVSGQTPAYIRFILVTDGTLSGAVDNVFACRMATAGITAAPDGTTTQISSATEFQRRVRFDGDELELERLFEKVWDGKQINLISVK